MLLLRGQRFHIALPGPQLETKQRWQHTLLLLRLRCRLSWRGMARLQQYGDQGDKQHTDELGTNSMLDALLWEEQVSADRAVMQFK